MCARQAGVGRAQEREEVAPLAVQPRVAKQRGERLAERRLAEPHPALERVGDAERREGGVERRAPALQRGADDRDLLRGSAVAQKAEGLVGHQLERAADPCAFEESEGAVELRRALGRLRAEEEALELPQDRRARVGARRQLLDPTVGEAGQVVGRTSERREGVPAGLVRQRDGHLCPRGESLEQGPLGAGQILEAVGEDRARLPGREVAGRALGGVATLELTVPEAEPVELVAVGLVELGQLAVELRRLEQRGLELGHRRAERVGEAGEARRAVSRPRNHAPQQQRPLRGGDHRLTHTRLGVTRDVLEHIVEGADRAADERAGARQQLALGAVDVRPVRHDQDRIGFERGQVALEQERDLPRVGGACKEAQRHRPILALGWDGSETPKKRAAGLPAPQF